MAINTISADHFPRKVLALISLLEIAGYETWLVGGAVRNVLLGRANDDFDLATAALPEQVCNILSDAGYKVIATGLNFGTATVRLDSQLKCEITTFRQESDYSDFRHPDRISYSDSLSRDLKRRDFTINTIAWHPDRGIFDEAGGIADLTAGVIRAVGNPEDRFAEDPLRILRALRFAAILDFSIEDATGSAMHRYRYSLLRIAGERIASEWNQILLGQKWLEIVQGNKEIISVFIPYISRLKKQVWCLDVQEQENVVSAAVNLDHPTLLQMIILAENSEASRDEFMTVLADLHYSRQFCKAAMALFNLILDIEKIIWPDVSAFYESEERQLIHKILIGYGANNIKLFFICAQYLSGVNRHKIESFSHLFHSYMSENLPISVSDLKINGEDIMQILNLKQGRQIGDLLRRLLFEVVSGTVPNERSCQIHWLQNQNDRKDI